jgi:hypothetical protein
MNMIGKYIYGMINSNKALRFSIALDSVGENGTARVYTISYMDVSAVVSDTEIVNYTYRHKDILARQLLKHQRVIEEIMPQHSVIPMQVGVFAHDENEVLEILSRGHKIIKKVFATIRDKIEIDVAATWSDFNSVLKEVGEEKEILAHKARLLANPEGISADERMKIGFMVKQVLDKKREKYVQEIQSSLKSVSLESRAHELMDDKMVINAAFLINKAECSDFEREVEKLNAKFNEKLNFRCVGPLPLYSFYTLEIMKLKFEEIDWAKKRLGIVDDITSKNELKKAYQRQALFTHPDKNPNEPCAEKEFDEVNKAYKILTEYCAALVQGNQKDNPMLVRVRG